MFSFRKGAKLTRCRQQAPSSVRLMEHVQHHLSYVVLNPESAELLEPGRSLKHADPSFHAVHLIDCQAMKRKDIYSGVPCR